MSSQIKAGLLLYRYKNEGLEVYLVPSEDSETLQMPESTTFESQEAVDTFCSQVEKLTGIRLNTEDLITLELVDCMVSGKRFLAYALETDWEKLPPISRRRRFLEANKGTYIAIKEAFKKVMPAQYAMLKELHEILSVRNLIKNM